MSYRNNVTPQENTSHHTFGAGVGKEHDLRARNIWVYAILTLSIIALTARYAKFFAFATASKYKGRLLTAEDELTIRELLWKNQEQDSLGYFATRRDKRVIFAPGKTAAVTYRILGGVSLAAADPIGPESSWPDAIQEWMAEATSNHLIPSVLAASEKGARCYEQFGLRALELGDEAVINVHEFSRSTRRRAPLRKAAAKIRLAGFTAQVRRQKDIPQDELYQITSRTAQWRETEGERCGFSMALSRLGEPADELCVLVTVLDPEGMIQGVLSLVPWGYHGLSLDFMCTNRNSQSGLCEFMISELVAASPQLAVSKISLNFVQFRYVFKEADSLGAGLFFWGYRELVRLLSRVVQLESLYLSTMKCDPQWQPKYSCYPRVSQVPRITWLSLTAEGYLPYWRKSSTPHSEGHTDNFIKAVRKINTSTVSQDTSLVPQIDNLRHTKLIQYQAAYDNPCNGTFSPDSDLAVVQKSFCELPTNTSSGKSLNLAGRVLSKRDMGKVCFLMLSDFGGSIQAILNAEKLGLDHFRETVRQIDPGDMIGVRGEILKSRRGELSILVSEWVLTAKCLRVLPRQQRSLFQEIHQADSSVTSLINCPEPRRMISLRSLVKSVLYQCLIEHRFFEVEPPLALQQKEARCENVGSAYNTITRLPLDTFTECGLYLKTLCVAGASRIFGFIRSSCMDGDQTSNGESTVLHAYQVCTDYLSAIDLVRRLVQGVASNAHERDMAKRRTNDGVVEVDISGQWQVITVHAAVARALQSLITTGTAYEDLLGLCQRSGIKAPPRTSRDQLIMCVFEQLVVPSTKGPTIYTDFPLEFSPYTRQHRDDPRLAERWVLVIFGVRIATGWSEPTDPTEFRRQMALESKNTVSSPDPSGFKSKVIYLQALERGLAPTTGFIIGVECLLAILTRSDV